MSEIIISASKNPGVLGETVHNAGYKALGLDYVYKACKISHIYEALDAISVLGFRGCSVSMPFKEEIIPYLNTIDTVAKEIGAVNTIIRDNNGCFTGYNTDYIGVMESLRILNIKEGMTAVILGDGGAAKAVNFALKKFRVNKVIHCSRKQNTWNDRTYWSADILINTTPVGTSIADESPIPISKINNFKAVFDIINKNTKLIKAANVMNIPHLNGIQMFLEQAYAQFEIYTGVPAPKREMEEAINGLQS